MFQEITKTKIKEKKNKAQSTSTRFGHSFQFHSIHPDMYVTAYGRKQRLISESVKTREDKQFIIIADLLMLRFTL